MKSSKFKVKNLKKFKKLWIGIAILIILSPVGLILPELFKDRRRMGRMGLRMRLKRLQDMFHTDLKNCRNSGKLRSLIMHFQAGTKGLSHTQAIYFQE